MLRARCGAQKQRLLQRISSAVTAFSFAASPICIGGCGAWTCALLRGGHLFLFVLEEVRFALRAARRGHVVATRGRLRRRSTVRIAATGPPLPLPPPLCAAAMPEAASSIADTEISLIMFIDNLPRPSFCIDWRTVQTTAGQQACGPQVECNGLPTPLQEQFYRARPFTPAARAARESVVRRRCPEAPSTMPGPTLHAPGQSRRGTR
jgi:hypothetical protein